MKKYLLIIIILGIAFVGCGKKEKIDKTERVPINKTERIPEGSKTMIPSSSSWGGELSLVSV